MIPSSTGTIAKLRTSGLQEGRNTVGGELVQIDAQRVTLGHDNLGNRVVLRCCLLGPLPLALLQDPLRVQLGQQGAFPNHSNFVCAKWYVALVTQSCSSKPLCPSPHCYPCYDSASTNIPFNTDTRSTISARPLIPLPRVLLAIVDRRPSARKKPMMAFSLDNHNENHFKVDKPNSKSQACFQPGTWKACGLASVPFAARALALPCCTRRPEGERSRQSCDPPL